MKKMSAAIIAIVMALMLCPAIAIADDAQQSKPGVSTSLTTQGALTTQASDVLANNGVYVISSSLASDTKMLDVVDASTVPGTNVQLFDSNTSMAQYWIAKKASGGYYKLYTLNGDNTLATAASAQSGSNVNIASASSNSGTLWKITKNSDGTFTLSPKSNSSLALDIANGKSANGTNVRVWRKNGTSAQKFVIKKMAGLTAAYANGKTISEGSYNIATKLAGQRVVDVTSGSLSAGANIQLWRSNNTAAQKFKFVYHGKGLYSIQGSASGKNLDVAHGSTSPGANVWQYNTNYTLAQLWYVVKKGSGYQIISAKSGLAMEVEGGKTAPGTNICIAKNNGSAKQVFTFKNPPLLSNGTYVFQSAILSPFVLDIEQGSTAARANVRLWRSNGTPAQQFNVEHIGGGVYTIQNVKSGKYLDVANGSTSPGGNVWQYNYNGTPAQQWRAELGANGSYVFKNVKSGLALDVSGGVARRGTNVQQWSPNGLTPQGFYLKNGNWSYYSGASASAVNYIAYAEQYEGWRYHWGGRSPQTSFDCSGLVMYCANHALGKNYDLMNTNASMLASMCTRISASEARPGDLVFYIGTYGSMTNISHVVIYCGNGIMYGAGDPIGYDRVDVIKNLAKQPASYFYARMR